MSRISRHVFAMESAEVAAKRATCYRLAVGAVITLDGRIIATGYNGPPSGEPHCQGNTCARTESGGCGRAIHAEANAMKFVAEYIPHLRVSEAILYATTCPCPSCIEKISAFGIRRVIYRHDYRSMALSLFREHSIKVLKLTASGYLVDPYTGDMVHE